MEKLKLYFDFLKIAISGKIQYKVDFIVGVLSIIVLNAVNISLIGIMVYNFETLAGWGIWQLMFLYCFWMLSRGLYGLFFGHFYDLEELIVTGNFDVYLIRPASPALQFFGKDINYMGVGDLLVGIIGFVVVWGQIDFDWSTGRWVYMIVCIISGAVIQIAINWGCASLCFWTTRSRAFLNITERFTVLMQQYPVSIFGKYFRIFVTCFLPVAFINFYPSQILLGVADAPIAFWQYFSPLVAVLLLGVAAIIWSQGIKRYAGAGN